MPNHLQGTAIMQYIIFLNPCIIIKDSSQIHYNLQKFTNAQAF